MNHDQPKSITIWFEQLRQGDADAAGKLWDRFFERLVAFARSRMSNVNRRVADEEDIAAGVMQALCDCADRGKLPTIESRDDLWRLLLCWARHNISDHVRNDKLLKRGGGAVRGDSVFEAADAAGFDQFEDSQVPAADVLMELDEQFDKLMAGLPNDSLREIATLRMHGHTTHEIAKILEVSPRTIERKLNLIRRTWQPDSESQVS